MKNVIEVCAGSYADCLAAEKGGATRVELNSALSVGGLTPTLATLKRVKEETSLKVICMDRPRAAGFCYDENDTVYTVTQTSLAGLCKDPKDLYKAQTLTDKTIDDVAAMQVGDLSFTQTDGTWTLTDDPNYALDQDAVKKMANTVCGVKTDWTITAPQADSAYGLDTPDVTVTVTFTDGSELTVRFGNLTQTDTTLCYLASSGAPDLVYEASADYKNAFAVTRESLQVTEATAESAAEEDTIVAEHPVGGKDDYADADQEE